jgi:hypothetical protein
MKCKIILLLLIIFCKTHSQIERRNGEIQITKEVFFFEDYNKSKKRKIAKVEFYFNEFGNILETISYGRQHFNSLKVIGDIEQFTYQNGNLVSKIYWISSSENEEFSAYTIQYIYDDKNVLIKKVFSNPLSPPQIFTYSENKTEIHSNETVYCQKKYDSENRIIELNQIFEDTNKIRWQHLFSYRGNCKFGNFQTYYGDGKDNSSTEVLCYDKENNLISKEVIDFTKTKFIYKYSKNGIVTEIKEFESPMEFKGYKLLRLTKFKINKTVGNESQIRIQKINSELIGE